MRKRNHGLGFATLLAAAYTALSFSAYAQQVLNNNPLAFWEFNAASGTTAVNSGSLGAAGAFTCRSMIWRRSWVGSWT